MVEPIKSIGRSILTPTQSVKSGNAFDRMGEAAGKLGEIVSAQATDLAVTQATQEGQLAGLEGTAPDKLAFPLTKATKAYNKAVADTEANRLITSAKSQMVQTYLEDSNPATFNRDTPAQFAAKLDGIAEGVLESTRPENRAKVANQIAAAQAGASLKMLQHAIAFDNKRIEQDFQHDTQAALEAMKNAAVAGDGQAEQEAEKLLNETIDNYSLQSEEIKQMVPQLRKAIEERKTINAQLGEFSKAVASGRQNKWLSDFMENKQKIPFTTWQKASKEILQLKNTDDKLKNDIRTQEFIGASNDIASGAITGEGQLLNFPNLGINELLRLKGQLKQKQFRDARQNNDILNAQKEIARGRGPQVSGNTVDKMLKVSVAQKEQDTGKVATLPEQGEMIRGEGDYPASGKQGLSLGRNSPAYDAQITSQLTSGNPAAVAQAASIFNDMAIVREKPELINISGQALAIATKFNSLNSGNVDSIELAKQVSDEVLKAKEPEMQERVARFNREYRVDPRTGRSRLTDLYKDAFGVDPNTQLNAASFSFFKEAFKLNWLNSTSEDATMKATKYQMRSFGESFYGPPGMLMRTVPEKELTIANTGFAFDNQIRARLQLAINNNNKFIEQGIKTNTIEWADTEQPIDFKGISQEDMVLKPLGQSIIKDAEKFSPEVQAALFDAALSQPKQRPRIKVNGVESEVFLMETPDSRLGKRLRYALGYLDKFGNLQTLTDLTNPTGAAIFSPEELEQWAPAVAANQQSETLKQAAVNIARNQDIQRFKLNEKLSSLQKRVPGFVDSALAFSRFMAGESQASNPERIQKILEQKIQGVKPTQTLKEAVQASNVGIQQEPEGEQ